MAKSYVKYIAALLLFGSNGIIASFITLSSYEIVLTRTFIGSLLLIIIFVFSKKKTRFWADKKQLGLIAISGVEMGVSWIFLFEAFKLIGVSVASLAYYCGPVLVMVFAPVVFGEKFTAAKIFGFVAVLIGMLCVNGTGASSGGLSWGFICGILSAVMYCVMVIFNKKAHSITGLENAMCQLVISFVTVAAYTLLTHPGAISIPRGSIIPVLILGFVNTGAGCYLYFSSIKNLSAQSVSICGYLEPLSALVFSAMFLQERLTVIQIAGAALIIGGAAFSELFKVRKRERSSSEI